MTSRRFAISALVLCVLVGWTQAQEPCTSCQGEGRLKRWFNRNSERDDRITQYNYPPKHKPRFRWFGLKCFGNYNDYSCSNLKTEYHFIFGSCRDFFGERCLAGPPADPVVVYRYNQRLFPFSGDHTVPESSMIDIFGNTEESKALYPGYLPTLPQKIHHNKEQRHQ